MSPTTEFNEYKCPACGLSFLCDLGRSEVALCPLCGYHQPTEVEALTEAELEQAVYDETREELGKDLS